MFSLIFDRFLLFLFICRFLSATGTDIRGESQENSDKLTASDRNSLWFGPRLGKRSLETPTEDSRQVFLKLLEAADALKFYYNQLPIYEDDPDLRDVRMALPPVAQKMLFTPKLGRSVHEKRYDVDFTPRLGRKLPEDVPATPPEETYPKRMNDKSKFFSPRLGRTMNFSPRLGRELSSIYDIYPENIRIVRSVNQTKT